VLSWQSVPVRVVSEALMSETSAACFEQLDFQTSNIRHHMHTSLFAIISGQYLFAAPD